MTNKSITRTVNDEPFDIWEFLKRHMRADRYLNERGQVYTAGELHELNRQAIEIFQKEPTLAVISPPVYIVGDIHGQYRDLIRILTVQKPGSKVVKAADFSSVAGFSTHRYMFLGDFVDRGSFSVECIALVFALKINWPQQYMLLRGNHETKNINNLVQRNKTYEEETAGVMNKFLLKIHEEMVQFSMPSEFFWCESKNEELVNKLGEKEGVEVWEHFNEAFSWMPLAGLVGGKILCMHGGISPLLHSLDDIRKIKRPIVDLAENKLALDLLWSDPLDNGNISAVNEEPQYLKNTQRGLSFTFNGGALRECLINLKVDMVVRAHQVQEPGFKFSPDRKLVTIFSAPNYMKENDNLGAILRVGKDGSLNIRLLHPTTKTGKEKEHEVTRGDSSEKDDKKKELPTTQSTQSITKSTKSGSMRSKRSSSKKSKRSSSKKSKRSTKRKETKGG